MRYFISHHQHKGAPIALALAQQGWISRRRRMDIALFDHYINRANPDRGNAIIDQYYHIEKATIIGYPHGATGSWWMDGDLYKPDPHVYANLVIGEGHKEIDKIIQPTIHDYVIGWYYCPIQSFKKRNVKNILFAPTHGTITGSVLRSECIDINKSVYEALLKISDRYRITVRYIGSLEPIGLYPDKRVTFKLGKPDGSFNDIDAADLVIAEGTFMYLSVARGVPTIGINQRIPIRPNNERLNFTPKNWDKYGDFMAYPIDFSDDNLESLIQRASSEEQSKWKELFIGNELHPRELAQLLTELRKNDISTRLKEIQK